MVKYFTILENKICNVDKKFFSTIKTRLEALIMCKEILIKINELLIQESINKKQIYFDRIRIVKGLQRSLDELDKCWPFIKLEFSSVPRKFNGLINNVC
jgi:hypothetical protein